MKTPNTPSVVSEMDDISHPSHEEPSMPLWDWNEFIDFNIDDQLGVSLPPPLSDPLPIPAAASPETADKVRKRDPRLTCPNFMAGIVPCACPELDEMIAEEERLLPRKKRARAVRSSAGKATCQVPGCEADIRELKGYHKRHRVCLRCANASSVVLDGQRQRYCQQCGKFHVLSDFDEGKRSCRRKLERHNRLRRKLTDSKAAAEKESQGGFSGEDGNCDDEAGKDTACLSSHDAEKETLVGSEEGRVSTLCSAPGSQDIQSDNVVSFVASGEAEMDRGKDDFKALSPSYCDNKSAYSSTCPTGRISFKLYDWNPAEFPRRLRHQIFQWLASMPVELEGYIRPGCTILTAFIAMPKFMWDKLSGDAATYIHNLVAPGKILSGRGTLFVNVNDMIFHVVKEEISVMKAVRPPKLHYVHPSCFEAGKPIEFVACGSNLLQPKFRFLVSFAGKYLLHENCVPLPYGKTAGVDACGFDHQLYKINIPCTEPGLFGPAFIEVENQSGLSNFIPILIGDKEICSETRTIQQKLDASLYSKGSQFAAIRSLSDSCEVSVLRQRTFSDFLLDIGWLLREPAMEDTDHSASSRIERFTSLLIFLVQNESSIILERVLPYMKILMDNMRLNSPASDTTDAHVRLFQKNMYRARDIVHQKLVVRSGDLLLKGDCFSQRSENGAALALPTIDQEDRAEETSSDRSETVPLLCNEVVMNVDLVKEHPRKPCSSIVFNTVLTCRRKPFSRTFPSKVLKSRPLTFVVAAAAAICLGVCAAVLHPQKVGLFANHPQVSF